MGGMGGMVFVIVLIWLLGHALASLPATPVRAYVSVCVIAALASLITGGLGLVVGGLLAREVADQTRAPKDKVATPADGLDASRLLTSLIGFACLSGDPLQGRWISDADLFTGAQIHLKCSH